MPRRNRRRPQPDPTSFAKLAQELHDAWNRAHGRMTDTEWRRDRERTERHRAQRLTQQPRVERVSLADARALLADYIV